MTIVGSYVLGLEKNFRGSDLLDNLVALGLQPRVVWGLEVSMYCQEYLDSLIDQKKCKLILGRTLSHFELSCALGHLEMYEEFLADEADWGIFLEDDAILRPEFPKLITRVTSLSGPIVVSLASSNDVRFEPRPFPFHEERLDNDSLKDFFLCAIPPVLAHGYLMNRAAALIAVHTLRGKRVYSPADFPFEFRNLVPFFASETEYVGVRETESTIEESRVGTYAPKTSNTTRETISRRIRVFIDYSGLGVVRAKRMGISGKFFYHEKVRLRKFYKKFRRSTLAKSTR
jgi:hypothetical protein